MRDCNPHKLEQTARLDVRRNSARDMQMCVPIVQSRGENFGQVDVARSGDRPQRVVRAIDRATFGRNPCIHCESRGVFQRVYEIAEIRTRPLQRVSLEVPASRLDRMVVKAHSASGLKPDPLRPLAT